MVGAVGALFSLLVFVTVALTAFAIGLLTSRASLRRALGRPGFLWVLLVNFGWVPASALVLVGFFDLPAGAETGILLCAAVAAGPLGLKASQIALGDLPWALSVTAAMLPLNVIALPLWSVLALGQSVTLRIVDLGGVLAGALVIPAILGMRLRRAGSLDADSLYRLTTAVSTVTFVLAVVVGVFADVDRLVASLSSWGPAAAASVVVAAGVAGWLLPDGLKRRRSTSLVTLNRATSVALLVAARSFSEPDVLTTVIVFGLIQTVLGVTMSCYWRWGRRSEIGLAEPDLGIAG